MLADQFVLARVVKMRGVDLRRFDFDYDLTWVGFFLDPQGNVLGRFGGRDARSPDSYLTLAGLKQAMLAQLAAIQSGAKGAPPPATAEDGFARPEDYPAAKRLKADSCIHCHQVNNFRQDWHRSKNSWTLDRVWVYPPPDNLGLTLDPQRQDRVKAVRPDSPAARAGLRADDHLFELNGQRVASFADAQYALHRAPKTGKVAVAWRRGEQSLRGEIELLAGWRESDISWRESMWHLEPAASVHGPDLKPDEKQRLGLGPTRLAFRQAGFVPAPARAAGIRAGDVIVGVGGKEMEMTMTQFNAWVRLNYRVGETITFDVLRDGKRVSVPMTLPRAAE